MFTIFIITKYSISLYILFNNQSIVRILVPSMKDQLNFGQAQTVLDQKDRSQIKITQEQMPVIIFDTQTFDVTLNGQPVVYENQVLTLQGLQIMNNKNNMQLGLGIEVVRADLKPSIQFDTKLNQIKYCHQLSKALDRASNSVYLSRKKKRIVSSSPSSSPAGYCLQICQYIVRKIPLKSRCFQTVFNNLQLHKISLLLQSNSFFLQVLKFICQILFKVNIQDINTRQAFPSENSQYFASYVNQKHQRQHKIDISPKAQRFKRTQQKRKTKNNSHVSQYQTKVLMVFEDIRQKIELFKLSFQRINLLLSIFTRQNRLSTFLYQLNRQLIIKELKDFLPKTFITDNPTRTNNIKILNNLVSLIKTTNTSLGKSQRSFQILKNNLLENGLFSKWIKVNIEFISSTFQCSHKLLQLLYLIAEINPKEITNIYLQNQRVLNSLVFNQVQWIYETLNFNYQTEQKQKQLREKAYSVLDDLINICKITVKQTASAINFGRIICKSICDIATKLRPCDLEALTYVCIVNSFSRQIILKYLFGYFRKFIRNIKNSFKVNQITAIKIARQNKSFLLQIMQSIRQIASIQGIDFSIQSELLSDIQLILDTACPKNKLFSDSSNNKKWKGNCLTSAYEEMIKNITIVKSKQKQNISNEFKYVEQ